MQNGSAFAIALSVALLASCECGGSFATTTDNDGPGATAQPDASMERPGNTMPDPIDLPDDTADPDPTMSTFDAGPTLVVDLVDAGPPPAPVTIVYGHSATTLYALDPVTKAVRKVGDFSCTSDVTDLAIDENSNAYITSMSGFFSLNLSNAQCSLIQNFSYPNSLSFVPKGTLDPNAEVLVAFSGRFYVRINPANGFVSDLGELPDGYESSGDVVSVKGGATFLTVKGGPMNCDDCLLQIDPTNGTIIRNFGPLPYSNVFGISFWGGSVYGFTDSGQLFEISAGPSGIVTTPIAIPNAPSNLSFWGAGSSTSVPSTSRDGGSIELQ